MSFIYNNLAAICAAFAASTLAWLFGGLRSAVLMQVAPWLLVIVAQVIIFFPQRHENESTYDARLRVWDSLKADPVVWLVVGFMVLLTIPFVNTALCPVCDYALIAEGAKSEPLIPFLPFCVDVYDHYSVFLWFASAFSVMIAVRHSLVRRGKILFLKMIVWNGAALAVLGFLQAATKADGPLWMVGSDGMPLRSFFSSFGYTNDAGDYFTTLFCIAVGLWRWQFDEARALAKERDTTGPSHHGQFWEKNLFLVPAGLFYFAALNTLSRAAILMITMLAVVFFLHTFVVFLARIDKVKRVKRGALSLLILGLIAGASAIFMPDNMQKEMDTLDTYTVLNRVTGKTERHVTVANQLWADYRIFGCGGWGYKHLSFTKMEEKEYRRFVGKGSANVHNDLLQFLVEHGVVGVSLLVVIFCFLLWPITSVWKKLVMAVRFIKPREQPPRPVQIFVIPAPIFCIFAGAVATIIHSSYDCPLRSPAILTLFFATLAAMPAFLPKLTINKE